MFTYKKGIVTLLWRTSSIRVNHGMAANMSENTRENNNHKET